MDVGSIHAYTLSYGPHAGEQRPFLVTGVSADGKQHEGYLFGNASDDPQDGTPAVYGNGPVHLRGITAGSEGTDVLGPFAQKGPQERPQPDQPPQPPGPAPTRGSGPEAGQRTAQAGSVRPGEQAQTLREGTFHVPTSPTDPGRTDDAPPVAPRSDPDRGD